MFSKLLNRGAMQKFVRNYSGSAGNPFKVDLEAADKGQKIFDFISFFICLPVTVLYGAYIFKTMEHPKRPPFIPYDHIYIMNKPFCFGDGKHSLFFNPKVNSTIDGYETEEEEH